MPSPNRKARSRCTLSRQELIRILKKNKDRGKGRRERDKMEVWEGCHLHGMVRKGYSKEVNRHVDEGKDPVMG